MKGRGIDVSRELGFYELFSFLAIGLFLLTMVSSLPIFSEEISSYNLRAMLTKIASRGDRLIIDSEFRAARKGYLEPGLEKVVLRLIRRSARNGNV